jgi:hypothetical protein
MGTLIGVAECGARGNIGRGGRKWFDLCGSGSVASLLLEMGERPAPETSQRFKDRRCVLCVARKPGLGSQKIICEGAHKIPSGLKRRAEAMNRAAIRSYEATCRVSVWLV